tara:strand:- start:402 stop:986 length:585 start_codon:yes stop_codon:yes gene_type:complete
LHGVDKVSIVIHHGTTSQAGTPSLTVTAALGGEFGSGNAQTGQRLYSLMGNVNVLRANDPQTNMPNNPPALAGSTFTWQDAFIIQVTAVTGQAGTAWNGSMLDPNFTFALSATEAAFVDVCNVWTAQAFNSKGFAALDVTFAPGGSGHPCNNEPPIGSYSPDYTCKVVVTEVSSGRTGQVIFPAIRFQNDTWAV